MHCSCVVEELDRIFNVTTVLRRGLVMWPIMAGERRRLADARGAGNRESTRGGSSDSVSIPGGKRQALEVGRLAREEVEGERDLGALAEDVDSGARQIRRLVGRVGAGPRLERLEREGAEAPM